MKTIDKTRAAIGVLAMIGGNFAAPEGA